MKAYSRILSLRARWLGLIAAGLIALAAAWQHSPDLGSAVFRPEQRIEEVIVAGQALLDRSGKPASSPLPCSGRPLKVLQAALMTTLEQDATITGLQMAQAASQLDWSDCARFAQALQTAARMIRSDSFSRELVHAALAEDVSWTRQVPCVIGGDPSSPMLLGGNAARCASFAGLAASGEASISPSYRQQAQAIADAATMAAISGRWSPQGLLRVSLEPALFAPLDQWTRCLQTRHCPATPEILQLRNAAVVVMDAQAGTVLASWCHGTACSRALKQGPGILPAALVEAPPASTSKLLFALALAANSGTDPLLLQRQIKTSGQIDALVTKRNEWWEKQAICDHAPNAPCAIPVKTLRMAESLGWNAHCSPSGPRCGRWGMLKFDSPDLIPGQVGRIALGKPSAAGNTMLDWQQYDEIRQGKRQKPDNKADYANTSLAIQAVIGGGDSRVSALALATLPAQIWRVSKSIAPLVPRVAGDSPTHASSLPQPAPEWRDAAQTVLGGMRKVVQAAEPGWQGHGTAWPAWMREMKKPCDGPCGVSAKTGTVGRQDKGFGGTTTLSALVDTQEWSQWSGQPVPPPLGNRVLSIGVLAMPNEQAPRIHAASFLGMALIRQLLIPSMP